MNGWKTFTACVLNAVVVAVVPEVQELIKANPETYGVIVSVIGLVLRIVTRSPIFKKY